MTSLIYIPPLTLKGIGPENISVPNESVFNTNSLIAGGFGDNDFQQAKS